MVSVGKIFFTVFIGIGGSNAEVQGVESAQNSLFASAGRPFAPKGKDRLPTVLLSGEKKIYIYMYTHINKAMDSILSSSCSKLH